MEGKKPAANNPQTPCKITTRKLQFENESIGTQIVLYTAGSSFFRFTSNAACRTFHFYLLAGDSKRQG